MNWNEEKGHLAKALLVAIIALIMGTIIALFIGKAGASEFNPVELGDWEVVLPPQVGPAGVVFTLKNPNNEAEIRFAVALIRPSERGNELIAYGYVLNGELMFFIWDGARYSLHELPEENHNTLLVFLLSMEGEEI